MKKKRNPFLVFLTCVLAVPTCGVLTGEVILPAERAAQIALLRPWVMVGALLGVAHLLLRPVLRLLTAPLGCLTLGLFGLIIDVGLIYLCGALVKGFAVSGLLCAALTAVCVNAICALCGGR